MKPVKPVTSTTLTSCTHGLSGSQPKESKSLIKIKIKISSRLLLPQRSLLLPQQSPTAQAQPLQPCSVSLTDTHPHAAEKIKILNQNQNQNQNLLSSSSSTTINGGLTHTHTLPTPDAVSFAPALQLLTILEPLASDPL